MGWCMICLRRQQTNSRNERVGPKSTMPMTMRVVSEATTPAPNYDVMWNCYFSNTIKMTKHNLWVSFESGSFFSFVFRDSDIKQRMDFDRVRIAWRFSFVVSIFGYFTTTLICNEHNFIFVWCIFIKLTVVRLKSISVRCVFIFTESLQLRYPSQSHFGFRSQIIFTMYNSI